MFARHSLQWLRPSGVFAHYSLFPEKSPLLLQTQCLHLQKTSNEASGVLALWEGRLGDGECLKDIPRMPVGTGCPETCPGYHGRSLSPFARQRTIRTQFRELGSCCASEPYTELDTQWRPSPAQVARLATRRSPSGTSKAISCGVRRVE